MLLDNIMPVFDFNEVHAITVEASPAAIFRVLKELTPAEMPPFRLLFGFGSLRARAAGKGVLGFAGSQSLLERFLSAGFALLSEESGRELVLGTIGRFWSWISEPPQIATVANAQEFLAFDRPDYAKAALNFYVDRSHGDGGARVSSETRSLIALRKPIGC
ncbi:MAG: hypothetical protein ACE5KH_04845, partial [Candidatus Geothermarchaeales archaeon]